MRLSMHPLPKCCNLLGLEYCLHLMVHAVHRGGKTFVDRAPRRVDQHLVTCENGVDGVTLGGSQMKRAVHLREYRGMPRLGWREDMRRPDERVFDQKRERATTQDEQKPDQHGTQSHAHGTLRA